MTWVAGTGRRGPFLSSEKILGASIREHHNPGCGSSLSQGCELQDSLDQYTYSGTLQSVGGSRISSAAFGDIDNDGDLDLLHVDNFDPNTVWLNE